jgi:DNA polymerase-3 subunit gamma/tau
MSLYLKYRPKTVEELDLASVRRSLGEIIKANKIAHAYLLTGPRGAGKTSTARVMARIVNCEANREKLSEPCNTCDACQAILAGSAVDVIEIDAASNRGIDDIRELKEKIRLAPAMLPYKVYIIDEVHMLTTEAFNALLKTLEEPPAHSLFILCTTEIHKVPETIMSRCVRIQFTRATPEEMQRSFARVVAGEGADVAPEALARLAETVDGSFRDGVKILDQLLSMGKPVELADLEMILSGSSTLSFETFALQLAKRDLEAALATFYAVDAQGVDLTYVLVSLMRNLKELVLKEARRDLVPLIFRLDEVAVRLSQSQAGAILVEMAIVEWCTEGGEETGKKKTEKSGEKTETRNQKLEKSAEIKTDSGFKIQDLGNEEQEKGKDREVDSRGMTSLPARQVQDLRNEEQKVDARRESEPVSEGGTDMDHREVWTQLLGSLKGDSYSLGALLSKASPGKISGNELTIYVQYDFHRQQLMTERLRSKLEDLVSRVAGIPMKVRCEVGATQPLQASSRGDTMAQAAGDETLQMAEEIFAA